MIALALDPDEAADIADLIRENKIEWPDHSLKAFTRKGRATDALKTVAQWVAHREPGKEEESDPTPRLDMETVADALADVTRYDQRLGAWCAMSTVRWALSFQRFDPTPQSLPFAQPILDEIRNWVINGKLNRRRLAKEAKIVEKAERQDIPWPIVTSLIKLSRAGDDNVFAAASSNGSVVEALVKLERNWSMAAFPFHGASKDIRDAIADACRAFPVLSAQPQEFTRPRRNPSDTQTLRTMIEDMRHGRDEDITSFYGLSEEEANEYGDTIMRGRKTNWVGRKGALVQVDPNYVRAIQGNIFDATKLAAVADAVSEGQRPTFVVGYGEVGVIDEDDIDEDQEAFENGELMSERPFDKRDIGKLRFQIRDGNHRVFGALLGGETKVWIHLTPNLLQEVGEYREAKRTRKLAAYKKKFGPRYTKRMDAIDKLLRAG